MGVGGYRVVMMFSRPPQARADKTRAIKSWVRQELELDDDAVVLVTELACTEPGCPPLETIVALMAVGKERRQAKVHKGIDELEREDIVRMATALRTGAVHHDHG